MLQTQARGDQWWIAVLKADPLVWFTHEVSPAPLTGRTDHDVSPPPAERTDAEFARFRLL